MSLRPAWPGTGKQATCGVWETFRRIWWFSTCGRALRGRRRAPAGRIPDRLANRLTVKVARRPGLLWPPVRHDRMLRRGRHDVGSGGNASGARRVLGPITPGYARGLVPAARTPIRDKTGCRRRADLTRLALSAGLVLRSLSGRAAARHAAVGDSTPAMAASQEGGNHPCRGPGWAGEPMAQAGEPASFRADRTRQCPHNLPTRESRPGRHSRPPRLTAGGSGTRGTGSAWLFRRPLRVPAGRRAAGTLER